MGTLVRCILVVCPSRGPQWASCVCWWMPRRAHCRARPTLSMSYFGHDLLWPRPTFSTTYFGHDRLWPRPGRLWPRSVLGFFETEEAGGGPKGGDPKGGGPEGVGGQGVGNPNPEKELARRVRM